MKSTRKRLLIHCSFDEVLRFVPRVPASRSEGEENQTPRICVGPSVEKCLQAMPGCGNIIRWTREAGLPVIIHAYYLKSDNVRVDTVPFVADARYTGEMWVLDEPEDWIRADYEIMSCELKDAEDIFGDPIVSIRDVALRQVKYTDNLRNLVEGCGIDYQEFRSHFPSMTYAKIAGGLKDYELARAFRRKREEYQKRIGGKANGP